MKYQDFPESLPLSRQAVYREKDHWVWCGSPITDPDGGFHLYASRWRKDYPMYQGYILFSEIVHLYSEKLCGPYRFVEKVLPAGTGWDGKMAHNPSVVKYGDIYLLYYIGLNYDFAPPPPENVLSPDPPKPNPPNAPEAGILFARLIEAFTSEERLALLLALVLALVRSFNTIVNVSPTLRAR